MGKDFSLFEIKNVSLICIMRRSLVFIFLLSLESLKVCEIGVPPNFGIMYGVVWLCSAILVFIIS